jgi:hypothetical protein
MSGTSGNRLGVFGLVVIVLLSSLVTTSSVSGQPLPDLYPQITDVSIQKNQTVSTGDVAEGCAAATDGRTLIRFSHAAWNGGAGDLLMGDPACPNCEENPNASCGNPLFMCSGASGHGHPHMQEFSYYSVKNQQGAVVATGHKEGFCLVNSTCSTGFPPDTSAYPACSILSSGCADVYGSGLGCQYVDITGLAPGDYLLDVTLNKNQILAESNYLNNTQQIPFTVCSRRKAAGGSFTLRYPRRSGLTRDFIVTARSRISGLSGRFDPRRDPLTLEVFQNGSAYQNISVSAVAGLPGNGCDPRDGWRKVGPRRWKYRSLSGATTLGGCSSSGNSLSSIVLEPIGSSNTRYQITWRGNLLASSWYGQTTSVAARVSLQGTSTATNETCEPRVDLSSCSVKEVADQPVLSCS